MGNLEANGTGQVASSGVEDSVKEGLRFEGSGAARLSSDAMSDAMRAGSSGKRLTVS